MTHYMPEDDREAAEMLRQVNERLTDLEEQNTAETTPNVLRSTDEGVAVDDSVTATTGATTQFVWDQTRWDTVRTWDGTGSYALAFAAPDLINVANADDINTGGPYSNRTISWRFSPNNVAPANPQVIYEQGGGLRGYGLYVYNSRAWVAAWNKDSTQTTAEWETHLSSTTTLTNGETYHIALVQKDATDTPTDGVLRLVLDGVQETTGTGANVYAHSGDIVIGTGGNTSTTTGTNEGFAGVIDEGRIYNAGLTESQLADEYEYGTMFAGLVARWPFDEGSGTTAIDVVRDHDGTITGATYTDPLFPATA